MGDAAGEPADRLHALRRPEFALETLALGDIDHAHDHVGEIGRLARDAHRQQEVPVAAEPAHAQLGLERGRIVGHGEQQREPCALGRSAHDVSEGERQLAGALVEHGARRCVRFTDRPELRRFELQLWVLAQVQFG